MANTVTSPTGEILCYVCTMETTPTDNSAAKEVLVDREIDYLIALDSKGNDLLTPLGIFDYSEIAKGSSSNTELIDFSIHNRGLSADSLTIEVFDDSRLIYKEANTANFLPTGEYTWQWDGYGSDGILDTKVLKSEKLKVVLTAVMGAERKVYELKLKNKYKQIDWADVRIDRNAKTAEVTVRPSFSDGGVEGSGTATPYADRERMAKEGIEYYWSRNGTRGNGIGNSVNTPKGAYAVTVKADVSAEPKAGNFPLIEKLDPDEGRATSLAGFRKIYHNVGFWKMEMQKPKGYDDQHFKHTSAHELGHFILNGYGNLNYSWTHKGSTYLWQKSIANHPIPASGEIDLMHYFSEAPFNYLSHWSRSVANEQDVKGLIWLTRIKFND